MKPKADLHCHAQASCTREYLSRMGFILPNKKITDIASMIDFSRTYLNPIFYNIANLPKILNGVFENCQKTNVKFIALSIDYKVAIKVFGGDAQRFIDFLKGYNYPDLKILWDLGISRDTFLEEHRPIIDELIKSNFFTGIDLYATENSKPNSVFVDFYKSANGLGLITKVHCGEQLGADYILDCIRDFNPKQIQHGIRIVESKPAMDLAKRMGIVFNVCPTSNIILGYAKSHKDHPIKEMVENGLAVTVGTDDLLYFQSDINQEYKKLLDAKTLTAKQLEKIRKFGLKLAKLHSVSNLIKR
jgi:adenosine deaminase